MRKDDLIVVGVLNGRNGVDPPLSLPDDQAVEMLNIDRYHGMMGRKRPGSDLVTETGGTAFSSGLQSLFRHVPGADETLAELWAIDGAATPIVKRMTAGTTFADVTLDDAISTKPQEVMVAPLNGKLFLAYDSPQDRLHCYDPTLGSPRVRRVGIAPGVAAPTVANTGGGAYAAVARWYRVRWVHEVSAQPVTRRSEPTPAVAFTPSGAGTAARVTRPAIPNEGETGWELEVSLDNVTWNVLASDYLKPAGAGVPIATTFYDDSVVTTAYAGFAASDLSGAYGLFPSVKSLISDGNRLLGAGAWESAGATSSGKNSRVWYTPVLGSADKGDDERVPNQTSQKNWVDLNENDGGGIVGLGLVNSTPIVFKYRAIWKLIPTGDVVTPYLPKKLIDGIGCVAQKSIAIGEDEGGRPALYFLSHRGAYRLLATGLLQYLGRDNEDLTVNLGATTVVAHAVYYPAIHQYWLWIATGVSNDPDTRLVFDPLLGETDPVGRIRKGWFKHTGNAAGARCACLFANTLGAAMSRDLKPYMGRSSGTVIYKCDTTNTMDNATAFQATITTKPLRTGPPGTNIGVAESYLLAEANPNVTITQTLSRDYGLETRASTVGLTPDATETRVLKKFEASALSGAGTVHVTIGDGSALAQNWVLDTLTIPITAQERR